MAKTVTYRDDVKQLQVEVALQSGGAMITTTYAPKQDKAYTTFKTLPMTHQTELMSDRDLKINKGKKKEDIRKQEETWGSKRDESVTQENYDRFSTGSSAFEEEIYRGYFYVRPSKDDKIEENDPIHRLHAWYSGRLL